MLVGDFGLATSSLAAVDPSDVSPHAVTFEADMTLGIVNPYPLKFTLSFLTSLQKRLVHACTFLLKYSQGSVGRGIIQKLTCTVWAYVIFC